jgi:hypothetical protein
MTDIPKLVAPRCSKRTRSRNLSCNALDNISCDDVFSKVALDDNVWNSLSFDGKSHKSEIDILAKTPLSSLGAENENGLFDFDKASSVGDFSALSSNVDESDEEDDLFELAMPAMAGAGIRDHHSSLVTPEHKRIQSADLCRGVSVDTGLERKEYRVDVLRHLKQGVPLLKYGKRGYPHFRAFAISQDNRKLQWYSKNKSQQETSIYIGAIEDVVTGQKTKHFQRYPAPELSSNSFSIIFDNGKKSIDVIAKNASDFALWTHGLSALRRAEEIDKIDLVKEILVEMPTMKTRKGHVLNDEMKTKFELNCILKKYQKLSSKSNSHKYLAGDEYAVINHLKTKIEQGIKKVEEELGRSPSSADFELWTLSVDIEAFDNVILSK